MQSQVPQSQVPGREAAAKAEAMERTITTARAIAKIFFISLNPFQKFVIASEVGNQPWDAPRERDGKKPAIVGFFPSGEIIQVGFIPQ